MSFGVSNVALVLLRQSFDVPNARRDHTRFIDEATHHARYFAQHRRSVLEAALFAGKRKIGQVSEDDLELREVRCTTEKMYKKGFFSRVRSWKAPDGLRYAWYAADEGDVRLVETKSDKVMVYVHEEGKGTRIVISSQVLPFLELMLLTLLQREFEAIKERRKRQSEEDDKDGDLGVW